MVKKNDTKINLSYNVEYITRGIEYENLSISIHEAFANLIAQDRAQHERLQHLHERVQQLEYHAKVEELERKHHLYFYSFQRNEIIEKWKTRSARNTQVEQNYDLHFLFNE